MARKTKAEKAIETAVDAAMMKHLHNVQVDIMDLSKISKAGLEAANQGKDIEDAVKTAIQQYRKN